MPPLAPANDIQRLADPHSKDDDQLPQSAWQLESDDHFSGAKTNCSATRTIWSDTKMS